MREIIDQFAAENRNGMVSLENLQEQELMNQANDKSIVSGFNSMEEIGGAKTNEKDNGKESWEIDSGTQELNIDPTIQQIMSVANSKGQTRSSNFLELANTVSELFYRVQTFKFLNSA